MKRIFLIMLAVIVATIAVSAQIHFELSFDLESEEFVVHLHSESDWEEPPFNRTSTAQITLKSEAGKFDPVDVTSALSNVEWELNSEYLRPAESPDYDYFSIGLLSVGTDGIPYKAGEKVEVLRFRNGLGCISSISLIDNEIDEFMMPNTQRANIGNHITILGSMALNSYAGNIASTPIHCDPDKVQPAINEEPFFGFAPNPVKGIGFLSISWPYQDTDAVIKIMDVAGKEHHHKAIRVTGGSNKVALDFLDFVPGVYYVRVESNEWTAYVEEVIKIRE